MVESWCPAGCDPPGDRAAQGVRPRHDPGRRQKLQIGFAHRNTFVDIHVADRECQIYDSHGELLATIPKTNTKDISRYKAYGWSDTIG